VLKSTSSVLAHCNTNTAVNGLILTSPFNVMLLFPKGAHNLGGLYFVENVLLKMSISFFVLDKREACAALAGKFKGSVFRPRTLLRCEIECCNETNCNTHIPTLSQNAITFLIQNGIGNTFMFICQK